MKRIFAAAFFAFVLSAMPSHAATLTWNLVGVTFDDGATASGSFDYDADTDTYSAWDIDVTPGILSAYNYLPGVDSGFVGIHSAGQVDFVAFPPNTSGRYIRLVFDGALSNAGGTLDLLTANESWECGNCNPMRFIREGQVSSQQVPEPATIVLLSSSLLLAGLYRRRNQ